MKARIIRALVWLERDCGDSNYRMTGLELVVMAVFYPCFAVSIVRLVAIGVLLIGKLIC